MGIFLFCAVFVLVLQAIPVVSADVTLSRFEVFPAAAEILIEWETTSEVDILGFYINRSNSESGTYARISEIVPPEGSATDGAEYQFHDTNVVTENTYFYKLESVDNSNTSEFFGPISATVVVPTTTSTLTVTPSITGTLPTLTPGTPTQTMTRTVTISVLTRSLTPTSTETSPFSFFTNTPTHTFTPSLPPSITPTITLTPTVTITNTRYPYPTRKNTVTFTPTITATLEESRNQPNPLVQTLTGFVVVLVLGGTGLVVWVWQVQKQQGKR
jgi:hypothetical protein